MSHLITKISLSQCQSFSTIISLQKMGLAKDAPPIDNRFGLIGLPFHADCCMILNILVIKSPFREMGDRLDVATTMSYLLGSISLALSGDRSSH